MGPSRCGYGSLDWTRVRPGRWLVGWLVAHNLQITIPAGCLACRRTHSHSPSLTHSLTHSHSLTHLPFRWQFVQWPDRRNDVCLHTGQYVSAKTTRSTNSSHRAPAHTKPKTQTKMRTHARTHVPPVLTATGPGWLHVPGRQPG